MEIVKKKEGNTIQLVAEDGILVEKMQMKNVSVVGLS
jgi:hypothetical protein